MDSMQKTVSWSVSNQQKDLLLHTRSVDQLQGLY